MTLLIVLGGVVAIVAVAALLVLALDRWSGPNDCGASGPFIPPIIPGL